MLTKDVLTKTAGLEGLTAEQIEAIATLSSNDEQAVIGAKYREMHDAIDAKIKEVTGIEKGGDKTTDYLARVLNHSKNAILESTQLKQQLKEAQENNKPDERVEKLLADNTDLVKKLADKTEELKKQRASFEQEKNDYMVTSEISRAMSTINLNTDLPQVTLKLLCDNAINKVRQSNPEFIDDGKGNKVLSFRDADGVTLRNPDNKLNPFTAEEMLRSALKELGILSDEAADTAGGAGGRQQGAPLSTSLSGAGSKEQALRIAEKMALDKGFARGSADFSNAIAEIWAQNAAFLATLQ